METPVVAGPRTLKPRSRPRFVILAAGEIQTNLEIQRFLRGDEQRADGEVLAAGAARNLASHVRFMANFKLHRRKIFWVEESLAYMLAKTDLDVPVGDVRAPFPCFALVFTDRQTLSLAERMCANDPHCPLAGHFLRVVTVNVTEESMPETRVLSVGLAFDALGADPPHLIVHEIPLAEPLGRRHECHPENNLQRNPRWEYPARISMG